MSKLLSLKPWVSIEEAADYLQSIFNERVSVADVLRFCLSGNLVLSANFVNHGYAKLAKRVPIVEAGFSVMPSLIKDDPPILTISCTEDALPAYLEWLQLNPAHAAEIDNRTQSIFVCLRGDQVSATECITRGDDVETIAGLWDLSMIGAERLDVSHMLQEAIGGSPVELICLDGVLLVRSGAIYARLQDEFSEEELPSKKIVGTTYVERQSERNRRYFPAGRLPEDVAVVVRPDELLKFVARASGGAAEVDGPPVGTRERNNFLRIIAGLAKEARIDLSEGGGGAAQIEAAISLAGFDGPKERTIREILKGVRGLS